MFDQLFTLKQLSSSVNEYMENFENLMLRHGLQEEALAVIYKFINRL